MTPFVPSRRRLLQGLGVGLAFAATSARAAFPDRPSKIIVPWAAGGSTDAIARALAQKLSESFKQPFVVDNRPGNGGHIGADLAAKSPPDGYTSIVLELSHVYAPAVVAKLPYDVLRDFTPVTLIGTSPMILFGPPDAGDYRAYLKKLAASPVPPAMANTGTGSVSHLVGELFSQATGIKFNMVPYRGGAPAMTDLAAGQVSAYFATLATAAALMSAGKVKPLAVSSRRRSDVPVLRNLPTLAELGLKNVDVSQWWALALPATTPIEVNDKLRLETLAAMTDPKVLERMSTLGVELKGSSRDQLRGFMRAEAERWQTLAKGVGLTPQ